MWYRAAADAAVSVDPDPIESNPRTWLTFLHFANDAAGSSSDMQPLGLSSESIDEALGPVGDERAGSFRREDVCPVCLDTFENRTPDQPPLVQINKCGHVFCGSCISTWLADHGRSCPVCKCSVGATDSTTVSDGGQPARRSVLIGLVMAGDEPRNASLEDYIGGMVNDDYGIGSSVDDEGNGVVGDEFNDVDDDGYDDGDGEDDDIQQYFDSDDAR